MGYRSEFSSHDVRASAVSVKMTQSVDPDEMPLDVAFYQDLYLHDFVCTGSSKNGFNNGARPNHEKI